VSAGAQVEADDGRVVETAKDIVSFAHHAERSIGHFQDLHVSLVAGLSSQIPHYDMSIPRARENHAAIVE